jgi:hypothetical protein
VRLHDTSPDVDRPANSACYILKLRRIPGAEPCLQPLPAVARLRAGAGNDGRPEGKPAADLDSRPSILYHSRIAQLFCEIRRRRQYFLYMIVVQTDCLMFLNVKSRLFQFKQTCYRLLKYGIVRPQALELPSLAGKNVVVVGSAPKSQQPDGFDGTYRVVTVNASQVNIQAWGVVPDVTLIQYNQIEGQTTNAREVRRVLSGQRTGVLIVLLWRHELQRLKDGLAGIGYSFQFLRLMSRYERIALVHKVTGALNLELDSSSKYSNGVIATLLALNSGAKAVILTGINPMSSGHAYNSIGLPRLHASKDLDILRRLNRLGLPVFTADPAVAATTGLPIWTGATERAVPRYAVTGTLAD